MLNLKIGSAKLIDGVSYIETKQGQTGHAVYGPYEIYQSGHYVTDFDISGANQEALDTSEDCAIIDISSNKGSKIFAKERLTGAQIMSSARSIRLEFVLTESTVLEFRVYVTGVASLLISDRPRTKLIGDDDDAIKTALSVSRFPHPSTPGLPPFFVENEPRLRHLYMNGVDVKVNDQSVILNVKGVNLHSGSIDDIRFIGEIYFNNAYNFVCNGDTCVIDVGMNVGLASLYFANKDFVKEVHSFEPFKATYDRALRNLALNPKLSSKIKTNNFGLADFDDTISVFIPESENEDSGMFSIRGSRSGRQVEIHVRNAARVLKPIVASAIARDLNVVAKIDCEGSEFAVFPVLESSGLLDHISAYMIEWHRGIGPKTQMDLIVPLIKRGFVVFDTTETSGDNKVVRNGFLYAARPSQPTRRRPGKRQRH